VEESITVKLVSL